MMMSSTASKSKNDDELSSLQKEECRTPGNGFGIGKSKVLQALSCIDPARNTRELGEQH